MSWIEDKKKQDERMENIMINIKNDRKYLETILKELSEKELSYIINNIWR